MVTELGPRSIGDILDASVYVYRKCFRVYMAVVLAAYGLVLPALSLAVERFVEPIYALDSVDPATFFRALGAEGVRVVPLVGIFLFNLFLVRPVVEGAVLVVAGRACLPDGDAVCSFRSAYEGVFQNIGPLLGALTLQVLVYLGVIAVAAAIGFALSFVNLWLAFVSVLLALAGLALLGLEFAFVAEAVVLEKKKAFAALGRSRELVRGQIGRITLVYLLGLAVTVLLGRIVSLVMGLIVPGSAFFSTLGEMVATVVGLPFVWTSFVVLYVDIRVRKEGLDLWLRAERVFGDALPTE